MKTKKALVTGGNGFIGSNLVDELIKIGCDVTVIDNHSSDSYESPYINPKAENHKLDICNPAIEELFDGVNVVFHLAAESKIQATLENPMIAAKTNYVGTCNVLESAKKAGVKRVVFSSTCAVYGNSPIPANEDSEINCLNPYSVSKYAGEELCKMYTSLFGLETVILRYFNVYGERQAIKGLYAPVIGKFLKQKKNKEPLKIYGDGTQSRDFVYVKDVVDANIIASNINNKDIIGMKFNIGSGRSYAVLDIANMLGGELRHLPARDGEIKHMLANIGLAKKNLKWRPKKTLYQWIDEKSFNNWS
jgi:UDP-glucose 4-epimerase